MGYFDATRAAALRGDVIRAALLVFFDFRDDPGRFWLGSGSLRTLDSKVWRGSEGMGKITGLDSPVGTTAPVATFTLAGTNARTAALARSQRTLVKGRDVWVYIQFFTDTWALLDQPAVIWQGEMDQMKFEAKGNGIYNVSVSAECPWANRSKAPYGYLTDTDQNARFPGDRGLEQVASLPGKTIYWPA
ncbi:hypothetical protein [Methylobacterium sp. CM6244]